MTPVEDREIIDLLFERSEQAVSALDKKYGILVRKTAANILQDAQDAEECANDVWLAAWDSVPPKRPEPLGAYLCRIARNLAVSRLRGETAQKRDGGFALVLDELAECIPSPTDLQRELETREILDAVQCFFSTLDVDDRCLFVRRYWFADPVKDIAAAMGVRENKVSLRLFRLREKLRKQLQKEGLLV